MNNIYSDQNFYGNLNDLDSILDDTNNPVQKEIGKQVINKIKDFKEIIPTIKSEISDEFPTVKEDD
ncbi:hypothetical protein DSM07_00025 [Oenococcus sp. UCMA 16435]|nr:hypothetical protein DSM07_00025 [Oenococcus sp. UCMA 16435]